MRRSYPPGEVTDLRVGDQLVAICKCGTKRSTYVVREVTPRTAVIYRLVSGGGEYRIKRRDIFYRDGRAWGDHYRVQRPGGHKEGK